MKAPSAKYFGLGKNAWNIAYLFCKMSYKNCMWIFFSFLHKEKSFSTSKWAVWATSPKCNEPCGLTQGLWALPETAWHPDCCYCWFSDCRKKPSKWLSAGSLGNLRCVGQPSCRISSVRVNVCILPGSQSQLVASYSEMGLYVTAFRDL